MGKLEARFHQTTGKEPEYLFAIFGQFGASRLAEGVVPNFLVFRAECLGPQFDAEQLIIENFQAFPDSQIVDQVV
ncbi:MAG TPA: hypothetical protein ENN94_05570, partial [Geoalkalibacter subterraneus]|nr:hypothetical protein [Geoalkalibacter subterraneus]